ncbi:unnamed protein product [Coccothraustes coccothraustes]
MNASQTCGWTAAAQPEQRVLSRALRRGGMFSLGRLQAGLWLEERSSEHTRIAEERKGLRRSGAPSCALSLARSAPTQPPLSSVTCLLAALVVPLLWSCPGTFGDAP